MGKKGSLFLTLWLSGAGCAASLSDRGVAAHQAAARYHETAAQSLSAAAARSAGPQAALHRQQAASHQAAAAALLDAEQRACAGLSESERAMSPFGSRAEIEGVDPLYEGFALRKGGAKQVGAAVLLRPSPGVTRESLQRLVDCHIAHHAVLGPELPRASRCPLMLKGVVATVTPTAGALAIAMRSDDDDTAHELGLRAAALVHASPLLAQPRVSPAAVASR